jgi:hypothetical protein
MPSNTVSDGLCAPANGFEGVAEGVAKRLERDFEVELSGGEGRRNGFGTGGFWD